MRSTIIAVVAASALLVSTGVQAQASKSSPWYGELGYTSLKITDTGLSLKPAAVRGILGYGFHPNFALEGMLAVGARNDNSTISGVNVETKVQRAFGLYLKPRYSVTSDLELFARVGYADTKIKISGGGFSASDSDSDLSYGVGLSYKVTPMASLGIDYMSYYDKDGTKGNGFTLGIGFSF